MKAKLFSSVALVVGTLATAAVGQAETSSRDSSAALATQNSGLDFKLIGYVRTDTVFNMNDAVAHPSGTAIPIARFGIKGRAHKDISYVLDFEFGNGASGKINDAYLDYKATDKLDIQLGQSRNQTSFELVSTIKHRAFPDRAFNASLVPARRLGLTAFYGGTNYAASFSVSGEPAEKRSADDEGYAVTGRMSYAPVLTENSALHLGVAASWIKPDSSQNAVSYSARHETSVASIKSVSTGQILNVDSTLVNNFDTFAKAGPVWAMGEYTRTKVQRNASQEDVSFDAWYVQAGWILTGESRSYSPKSGVGGMKPFSDISEGGPGAVELAVRYDTLDLNDGLVRGGQIDRYSVSLNWYPVERVQLRAAFQASSSDGTSLLPQDKPKSVVLRAVWMF